MSFYTRGVHVWTPVRYNTIKYSYFQYVRQCTKWYTRITISRSFVRRIKKDAKDRIITHQSKFNFTNEYVHTHTCARARTMYTRTKSIYTNTIRISIYCRSCALFIQRVCKHDRLAWGCDYQRKYYR